MYLTTFILLSLGTFAAHPSLSLSAPAADSYVTTSLKDGVVRGRGSVVEGKTIETYYGIPYAQPPVGALRFKPPAPPSTWPGVRDAVLPSKRCIQYQYDGYIDFSSSSEDCLYINVHAPARSSQNSTLPVMVWIHGGGYRNGQGAPYDGSRLASREWSLLTTGPWNTIVVTLNYKLDALGFLSTENSVMPGNYGMLDMIAALKWVKTNIAIFGGNPDRVTIFGESAGSSAVSLLQLSPLAKGLFHGAIMQSGVSLAPWAYAHPARAVSHALFARLLAAQLGCASTNPVEVLQCFQGIDAQALVNASWSLTWVTAGNNLLMNPRVENVHGFLPDLPLRLWAKGNFAHVNTIRGFTMHEAGFFYDNRTLTYINSPQAFKEMTNDVLSLFTIVDKDQIALDIADYYFYNKTTYPLDYVKAAIDFGTDFNFVGPAANEVEMASKESSGEKHYLYQFSLRPGGSVQPDWVTAVHADDISFVFGLRMGNGDPTLRARSEDVMRMWTNFAKSGDPNCPRTNGCANGAWKPFYQNHQNMLNITLTGNALEQFDESTVTGSYFGFMQRIDTAIDPSSIVIG